MEDTEFANRETEQCKIHQMGLPTGNQHMEHPIQVGIPQVMGLAANSSAVFSY